MSNDITTETTVTLSIQQLEGLIRKVVREELSELAKQKPEIFMRTWRIFLKEKNQVN
ncbi:MAG: hypothetical protein J4F29_23565 [Candidatus Latescibacteria bacterium]|nr:hypothetical protein [Candidatus Latescibacterota bacterium]